MESAAISSQTGICPISKTKGKHIDTATLKSMLAISLATVQSVDYFFCGEPSCEVAYFSADGRQIFTKYEIRERIFQKEPESQDVLVCYCFRHSAGRIRAEILETGKSTVIEEIAAGIKAGQCACDWRNPQGDCCLGNVHQLVKQYLART